jgi:3-oxoacyl-[acyl-carrier-protein] synthase-3
MNDFALLSAPARVEPARAVRGTALLSVASAAPATTVTNAQVAARLGVSEQWIVERTGIRERRHAAEHETLVGLATEAGLLALARAGVAAADLDLVLVATMTPDSLLPNAAPLVAHALGAHRAGALDVGAACTAFIGALSLAAAQVEAGRADTVLVIGADVLSRVTDHDDRRTAALFGDGAGAVVITATEGEGRLGPVVLRADGAGADLIHGSHEERKVRMNGPETYRNAVMRMAEVTLEAAARAEVELGDIDLFVYHQANGRILSAVGERLGLPPERVVSCIERYGNTSAATIPMALADAEQGGRLQHGSTVLLAAFGAGVTWGGTVVEWGAP